MSLIQTSVLDQMPKGLPGYTAQVSKELSGINSESTLGIPFGIVVVQNKGASYLSDFQAAKLPTAEADTVLGISAWGPIVDTSLDASDGVKPGRIFKVAQAARVLVKVENAVVKGARPFFRITANGLLTQLGSLRSDADGGNAVELKGAYFMESGAADALVWLRIDDVANRAVQA